MFKLPLCVQSSDEGAAAPKEETLRYATGPAEKAELEGLPIKADELANTPDGATPPLSKLETYLLEEEDDDDE